MNKGETADLLSYIAIAYPNGKVEANTPTVEMWSQFTADLPYEMAKLAVDSMISTLSFPPTIADIRKAVAKSMSEARGEMTAGEALAQVRRTMKIHGYYDATKARKMMGEHLWSVVMMVAPCWEDLCASEDENWPARFERLYKVQADKRQYKAQVPAGIQDGMKALVEQMTGQKAIEESGRVIIPAEGVYDG